MIIIQKDLCKGCKICLEICPRDCFTFDDEKKSTFTSTFCHDCGHCISICPEQAISHQDFPKDDFAYINNYLEKSFLNSDQMYYFLKSIRSTRSYYKKPLNEQIIKQLIDVTRFSPTGHHSQNVELVVLSDPILIQKIKDESAKTITNILKKIDNPIIVFFSKLFGKSESIKKAKNARSRLTRMLNGFTQGKDYLFHNAPSIFIFHANAKSIVPSDSCSIASVYLRILAHTYELGSCYIGYIVNFAKYNKNIKSLLNVPAENQIYQAVIVGYPRYVFKTFVSRKPSKAHIF